MITVSTIRDKRRGILIDRSTILGNPFIIGKDGTREEVIEKYEKYALKRIKSRDFFYDELKKILRQHKKGVNVILKCHCKPKPCHGDIIKKLVHKIDVKTDGELF
jgi:predicted transcriptional regulator